MRAWLSLAALTLLAGATMLAAGGGTRTQEVTRPSFSEFLAGVRTEALARGIRPDIVDEALGGIEEPLPVVIERDRTQVETVLSLERYVAQRLTPKVLRTGRDMLARHRELLEQVSAKYGVPGPLILAIWGVESNFGQFSGIRPTVAALATLAWDPRRAAFFRTELFDALEMLNRGDIELARMRGSWAGAMGQTQFIPSSYLQYAVDFDGDGRRDIWASQGDIFASIANYLAGHGWMAGERWGQEVAVPAAAARRIAATIERRAGGCQATRDMSVSQPMNEWRELGVTALGGRPLPATDAPRSLVSGSKRHFLVSANYDALLAYNCAHAYAVSVALLADRIASPAQPAVRPPARRKPK